MEVFNKPNYLKITDESWQVLCLTDRPGLISKYRDYDTEETERQAVEEVLLHRKILEKRVYTEEPKEEKEEASKTFGELSREMEDKEAIRYDKLWEDAFTFNESQSDEKEVIEESTEIDEAILDDIIEGRTEHPIDPHKILKEIKEEQIEEKVIADFSEAQAFLDEMSDRGYLPLGDTGQFIGVNEFKVCNPSISTTRKKNSEDPITDREQYFKHVVGAIARFKPHRSKETIELPVSSFVFDKRALRFYTVMIDRTQKPNGRYKLYHKRSSEVEII